VLNLTTYSDKNIILGGCQKGKEEKVIKRNISCAKEEMTNKNQGNSIVKKVDA
jgi:hypothetical protein